MNDRATRWFVATSTKQGSEGQSTSQSHYRIHSKNPVKIVIWDQTLIKDTTESLEKTLWSKSYNGNEGRNESKVFCRQLLTEAPFNGRFKLILFGWVKTKCTISLLLHWRRRQICKEERKNKCHVIVPAIVCDASSRYDRWIFLWGNWHLYT